MTINQLVPYVKPLVPTTDYDGAKECNTIRNKFLSLLRIPLTNFP